jgi:hypothetical protein
MKSLIFISLSLPLACAIAANFWPRRFGYEDLGPFTSEWEGVPQTAFGWPFTYVRILNKPLASGAQVNWDFCSLAADGIMIAGVVVFTACILMIINRFVFAPPRL